MPETQTTHQIQDKSREAVRQNVSLQVLGFITLQWVKYNLQLVVDHSPNNHVREQTYVRKTRLCPGLLQMCLFEHHFCLKQFKVIFLVLFLSTRVFISANGKNKAFHGILHKHIKI